MVLRDRRDQAPIAVDVECRRPHYKRVVDNLRSKHALVIELWGRPLSELEAFPQALTYSAHYVRARAGFLQPHRAVLERFGANVPSAAAAAGAPAFRIDPAVGQPAEVGVPLRDYQLDGLRWLVAMHTSGTSAILADEMGLGKTLQTIALLAHLKFEKGVDGPHLVVCPLSVLSSWMIELRRFCPQLRAVKLHSSDAEERKRLITGSPSLPQEVDHFVFGGQRNWSEPLRVLVAGGGTGHGTGHRARESSPFGAAARTSTILRGSPAAARM